MPGYTGKLKLRYNPLYVNTKYKKNQIEVLQILIKFPCRGCQFKFNADFGLRIADWGLRISDFGLRTADCGLGIAVFGLFVGMCRFDRSRDHGEGL